MWNEQDDDGESYIILDDDIEEEAVEDHDDLCEDLQDNRNSIINSNGETNNAQEKGTHGTNCAILLKTKIQEENVAERNNLSENNAMSCSNGNVNRIVDNGMSCVIEEKCQDSSNDRGRSDQTDILKSGTSGTDNVRINDDHNYPKKHLTCGICNALFTTTGRLIGHIQKFHRKCYKCSKCDFSTYYETAYISHAIEHEKMETVDNSGGNVDSSNRNINDGRSSVNYSSHRSNSDHALKCTICGIMTSSINDLILHLEQFHDKPFTCQECNRTVTSGYSEQHMQKHTHCRLCDFVATEESSLADHLPTHKKPFPCPNCDYRTTRKRRLNTHMLKHGIFSCTMCNFKTKQKKRLNEHLTSGVSQ